MTPAARAWRPLRVVLGAAGLALLWFLLAPTSAQADDDLAGALPNLGATVKKAVTEPVKKAVVEPVTDVAASTTETSAAATAGVSSTASGTLDRATDIVDSTVRSTPVAPVVEPVSAPVTDAVDTVTEATRTTVDSAVGTASTQVSDTVEHTVATGTDAVDEVLGTLDREVVRPVDDIVGGVVDGVVAPVVDGVVAPVVDGVVAPVVDGVVAPVVDGVVAPVVDGVVAPVVDGVVSPGVPGVTLPGALDAVDGATSSPLLTGIAPNVVRASGVQLPFVLGAPSSSTIVEPAPLRAAPVAVARADRLGLPSHDSGIPAPLQPLSYLVSALAAGALASAFSGRGPLAGETAPILRLPLPTLSRETVRAVVARAVPGPALIPGFCPD